MTDEKQTSKDDPPTNVEVKAEANLNWNPWGDGNEEDENQIEEDTP